MLNDCSRQTGGGLDGQADAASQPAERILPEFATALRELRRQAGSPPFRQLARRAHYSPTTLSVACSGTVLPSLEVTLSLVRACGGREEEWRQRWTDAAAMSDSAAMSDAAPGRSW